MLSGKVIGSSRKELRIRISDWTCCCGPDKSELDSAFVGSAPLLIVKLGSTLVPQAGEFDALIGNGMGQGPLAHHVADVEKGDPLPAAADIAGAVLTGSAAMVTQRLPWSERTAAWLTALVEAQVPLLGICYGHQLMAHACGGRVGSNPNGREIGTIGVSLNNAAADDPLFSALPPKLVVHASHSESVLELPQDARPLAANAHDSHQAFALGPRAWGVQFHPEFTAEVMRGYIAARAEALREEGFVPSQLQAQVVQSPHGAKLLGNFLRIVCNTER